MRLACSLDPRLYSSMSGSPSAEDSYSDCIIDSIWNCISYLKIDSSISHPRMLLDITSPFPIMSISPVLNRGPPSLLQLSMRAYVASLIACLFSRLAEGCCSDICWYRSFWNPFRHWLVKGSRLLQLICQRIKYRQLKLT